MKPSAGDEVTFGPFRLNLRRRMLFRHDLPVPISSRAADILSALVAAAGSLVTKEELMARAWPQITVAENTLQVHVSALRKALCEDTGGQRHIVTIAGRGYRFIADAPKHGPLVLPAPDVDLAPMLPDKPSIAVMPFQSMSDDAGQDYFADGIAEDITTALSRMRWLFVIARNSSFTYKGRNVDVKLVGQELGVRYVVDGSVRKAGNRVRITGRLSDAASRNELWADRFDGGLEDIFGLQDTVASSVVSAIAPRLQEAEIERSHRKPTESLTAYDYYLRAMASMYQWTREGNEEALRLFYKAIDLDRGYACAHGLAALCFALRKMNGWTSDLLKEKAEAIQLAQRAAQLGPNDAIVLAASSFALSYVGHDLDSAVALVDRALILDPNLAAAWEYSGSIRNWLSEPEVGIDHTRHALRLSPLDPLLPRRKNSIGFAHFVAGRYDVALTWARQAIREKPNYLAGLRLVAASSALANRMEEAREAMAHHQRLDPKMHVSKMRDYNPLRRADDLARFEEGLRRAGMPE